MTESASALPMPCPACIDAGIGGGCRVGNRRGACKFCNRFVGNARNAALRALISRHGTEFTELLEDARLETYLAMTAEVSADA